MNNYLFVRHGQSQANLEKVIAGITDVELTEEGIQQAKYLANNLKDHKFDFIFCSNLTRAIQTAKEITKFHVDTPFIIDERLAERNYGVFEKLPYDNINNDSKGKDFWDTSKNVMVEGAETFEEYYNKVTSFFDSLSTTYQNKKILLISHGGVHRIITYLKENSNKNLLNKNIANTSNYNFEL